MNEIKSEKVWQILEPQQVIQYGLMQGVSRLCFHNPIKGPPTPSKSVSVSESRIGTKSEQYCSCSGLNGTGKN